jgi:hypothetical protein
MLKRFEIHSDLRFVVANIDKEDGTPSEEPNTGVYIFPRDYDKPISWEGTTLIWISDEELPKFISALQEFLK